MKRFAIILMLFPLLALGQSKAGFEICLALQSNSFTSDLNAKNILIYAYKLFSPSSPLMPVLYNTSIYWQSK